jgi:hypothetical protein
MVYFNASVPTAQDGGVAGNYEVILTLVIDPDEAAVLRLVVV